MSVQIVVTYHFEDGSWWADSADIPGWSAAGGTFRGTRDLVREAMEVLPEWGVVPRDADWREEYGSHPGFEATTTTSGAVSQFTWRVS